MPRGKATTGKTAKKIAKTSPSTRKKSARSLAKSSPSQDSTPVEAIFSETVNFDVDAITNYQELVAALEAQATRIILAGNIIVDGNILINHDVTINFNGYSIISEEHLVDARVFDIRSGEVKLTGKGKIFAMGPNSVAIRAFGAISTGVPNYTVITIDEEISIFAPDSYAILISPNLGVAYGLKLDFAGQIYARDGICLSSAIRGYNSTLPSISLKSSAKIIADELSGTAIEAAGYGKWNIAMSHLRGAIGISMTRGVIELSHAQITTTLGETFRVLENQAKDLIVKIDGGDYLSEQNSVIGGSPDSLKKFSLKNCKLYSAIEPISEGIDEIVDLKDVDTSEDVEAFLKAFLALDEPILEADDSSVSSKDTSAAPLENIVDTQVDSTISHQEKDAENVDPSDQDLLQNFESPDANELSDFDEPSEALDAELDPIEAAFLNSEAELDLDDEIDSDFDLAFEGDAEPVSPPPKKRTRKPRKKSTPVEVPKPFYEQASQVPELTDDATDEQEILSGLGLGSETVQIPEPATFAPPPQPLESIQPPIPPLMPMVPPLQPQAVPYISEQDATRQALSEAIADIRKLNAEDYEAGFHELEAAIQKSELILQNPNASLADIRDAASNLLSAFDGLEERDDSSMSDDELDELFYHGAVLQEVIREAKQRKSVKPKLKKSKSAPGFLPETPSAVAIAPVITAQPPISPNFTQAEPGDDDPSNPNLNPDFMALSNILNFIAGLDLNRFTSASQENLIRELTAAESILNDPQASQEDIDGLVYELENDLNSLVLIRQAHNSIRTSISMPSSPAPTLASIPPTMIDEMTPSSVWSLGVTMIDETTPFTTDATTREKMLRALRPRFSIIGDVIFGPFRRLSKGLSAGLRAGLRAYHETLHSSQK